MHHLRVDDATRISLIWVAPRIRFHEENFAWDGDNSGACYSRYIACARCWTKSITTSPGTILFRNMAILYTSIFRRKIFSLSLSRIACNYLLEYSNNLFYKYTHFLTNIFTLSQILTITYRLFIYLSNFRYDFYEIRRSNSIASIFLQRNANKTHEQ